MPYKVYHQQVQYLIQLFEHVEQVGDALAKTVGTRVLAVSKLVDTKVLAVAKPTVATFVAVDKLTGTTNVATTFVKCAVMVISLLAHQQPWGRGHQQVKANPQHTFLNLRQKVVSVADGAILE
jgi:hypothetical protein